MKFLVISFNFDIFYIKTALALYKCQCFELQIKPVYREDTLHHAAENLKFFY